MSDASLLRSSAPSESRTVARSVKSAFAVMGIRNKFQSAALKAVSSEAGGPKAKHVSVIIDFIQKEHSKLEELAVTYHALSPWAEKYVTCCKCLVTILVVLQTGPPAVSTAVDALNHFLSNIRDTWANEDMFLSQFAVMIMSRLNFLAEHEEFCNHFNLNATSSNGLSLPSIDTAEEISLLSQMLAMQGRLCSIIQLGLKNCHDASYFRAKERDLVKCALVTLYEDAFCAYVASTGILLSISQRAAGAEKRGSTASQSTSSSGTLQVLRELFDEQYSILRRQYTALEALNHSISSGGSGGGGGGYGVLGHELSRCPERNPLEAGAAGGGRPASALNIGSER